MLSHFWIVLITVGYCGWIALAESGTWNPTINWWVSASDKNGTQDLLSAVSSVPMNSAGEVYPLLRRMKAIYLCCNLFRSALAEDGKPFVEKKFTDDRLRHTIHLYRQTYKYVKLYAHVLIEFDAMITRRVATVYRSEFVSSLVNYAKNVGLEGLIIDYEPIVYYTWEHAQYFQTFLEEFAHQMREAGLVSGSCVSNWGILKFYELYGQTGVDRLLSMGNTYYGRDLQANRDDVNRMMEHIQTSRLEIGLGMIHSPGVVKVQNRHYKWRKEDLENFLQWIRQQGISSLHIWPGAWKSYHKSKRFFLNTLAEF